MYSRAGGGEAAGLLHDVRHGHALVHDPQLALGRLAGGRVHEDPAVLRSQEVKHYYFFIRRSSHLQGPVHVRDHGAYVPPSVRLALHQLDI